jgi:hypothetical protein
VDNKSARRWQDIAAELANEFDQERVLKLSAELDEALAEDLKKPVLQRRGVIAQVLQSARRC